MKVKGAWVLLLLVILIPCAYSSAVQTRSFLNSSDTTYASTVVEACLKDFQRIQVSLPREITIYLLPTFQERVWEFFGGGTLYQLFYPDNSIRMLFADRGEALPADFAGRKDILILQYVQGHVYDVTRSFTEHREEERTQDLFMDLARAGVSVDRNEYYNDYDHFQTPGGTPAFFPTPDRSILTQIGGSTVTAAVGTVPSNARLRFDISWMYSDGDGGWAEVRVRCAGSDDPVFHLRMEPNPRGGAAEWKEQEVDLSRYSGSEIELVLRCYNNPGHTTVADWLNWRHLRIQH